jgi:hypothetical protein
MFEIKLGCSVVSVTDPYDRNLGFLDRNLCSKLNYQLKLSSGHKKERDVTKNKHYT